MEKNLCIHDEILLEAPIEATDKVVFILRQVIGQKVLDKQSLFL